MYHAYNEVCTVYFYNLQFGWRCRVLAPLICLLYCEYCIVLYCVVSHTLCVWIIFGYVWLYYVISPVDIECEWLQINSKIANQLCPSLRIKMTVSKLYLYCACSILFLSLSLSPSLSLTQSACVCIVLLLDCFNVYVPNTISIHLVAIFVHIHAQHTLMNIEHTTSNAIFSLIKYTTFFHVYSSHFFSSLHHFMHAHVESILNANGKYNSNS